MTRRLIVEPRGLAPWWLKLIIPIGSVIAALIVGALFLAITGNDWVEVYNTNGDAFVTKFSSGGSMVYSTFIGGTSQEQAYAIALRDSQYATITGYTTSTDFPTTAGAFQTKPQ